MCILWILKIKKKSRIFTNLKKWNDLKKKFCYASQFWHFKVLHFSEVQTETSVISLSSFRN